VKGHPDQHFPRDKGGDADGHGESIAYEARTIPESDLNLERLPADWAALVHLHKPFEVIGVAIDEEMTPATTRATVAQNA
jgi:hypothetical protein